MTHVEHNMSTITTVQTYGFNSPRTITSELANFLRESPDLQDMISLTRLSKGSNVTSQAILTNLMAHLFYGPNSADRKVEGQVEGQVEEQVEGQVEEQKRRLKADEFMLKALPSTWTSLEKRGISPESMSFGNIQTLLGVNIVREGASEAECELEAARKATRDAENELEHGVDGEQEDQMLQFKTDHDLTKELDAVRVYRRSVKVLTRELRGMYQPVLAQ